MTATLLVRNGVVHTGEPISHATGSPTAVAVEAGHLVYVGDEAGAARYDGAERVVDVEGALIAPAFVDAHVHAVQTGFLATQVDLSGLGTLQETLDRVGAAARRTDDIVVGTGWDDSLWDERRAPTAAEIDAVAPGAQVLLTRLDCHSAVLSPALMVAIEGLSDQPGYDPHGHMILEAMAHTQQAMARLIGPDRRLQAARAAMRIFAGYGVAAFHENAAPHIGPAYEIPLVRRAAAEAGLLPTVYWGRHLALDDVAELGVAGLAGDLNADGSIGSRTAALHTAYADRPGHTGHAYLTAAEIAAHVVACTEAGVQGGFHCIGEEGLQAVTEGFRMAADTLGADAIRRGHHRLEHVEMPDADTLTMMADLGLIASMQPLFDELWGGPTQMYAERLGSRWQGMNPIGAMARAGITIALGSDTPVTRPNPWAAIRAACRHHEADQRVDRETAFRMHTVGGWRAAVHEGVGTLTVGAPAHVAVWDTPLEGTLPPLEADPFLRHLIVSGRPVLEEDTL